MLNRYDQQKHFYFFVISVDGMMGKEAQVILATLSIIMDDKIDEPISHVKCWFNGRIEIEVANLYSWVLCEYQVPSLLWTQEPDWESGLGLEH